LLSWPTCGGHNTLDSLQIIVTIVMLELTDVLEVSVGEWEIFLMDLAILASVNRTFPYTMTGVARGPAALPDLQIIYLTLHKNSRPYAAVTALRLRL